MNKIRLEGPISPIRGKVHITGSKSISNRVLLIRALSRSDFNISNLSNSDDTQILKALLESEMDEYDAHHAGTSFRFMTAYLAIQDETQILTGSDRMCQRPVGPLVNALCEIGADIAYMEKEGFPPLKINPFKGQKNRCINIKADVSSQFISALCLIAPVLKDGLTVELIGDHVSRPYLEMTLSIMKEMGVDSEFRGNTIEISPQQYRPKGYMVESDWSSCSYYFSIAAISDDCEIELSNFFENSLQGDSAIINMCKDLGVKANFENNLLRLQSVKASADDFGYDFIMQPDLAQTIAVLCAGKNIDASYKGLKTLVIKETDRVAALKQELKKVGITIFKDPSGNWEYKQTGKAILNTPEFDTYQDHRMAMALAPLSLVAPIVIHEPMVVTKSYPNFWKDLEYLGFNVIPIE